MSKSNKEIEKECPHCKKKFIASGINRLRQKCCSKDCRLKHWRVINKKYMKQYNKQYYEIHKEKIKEYQKNREEYKEYHKKYNKINKEKIKEYQKNYNEDNKEKLRKYRKEYNEGHKEEISQKRKLFYKYHKEEIRQKRIKKRQIITQLKQVAMDHKTFCIIEEELRTKNGWTKEEFKEMYPTNNGDHYKNKYWLVKSILVLERAKSICLDCGGFATMVEHKRSFYFNPEIALMDSNLDPLCEDCEQERHRKKDLAYQKRRIRVMDFPEEIP